MEGRQVLKVVSFAIEPEQDAQLAAVAARERRSKSFLVRDALADWLLRDQRQHGTAQERAAR